MLSGQIALAAIAYLLLLFAVAHFGDRRPAKRRAASRPGVYSLSLAVYCTSWTFLGSVGGAARDGFSFLAIYIGPIAVFLLAPQLIGRIIRLAKTEKITTIADFIAARYGKSPSIASIATLIALVGTVPYISLQLKGISTSVSALVVHYQVGPIPLPLPPLFGDLALPVALTLGIFAILFGTRHADATEHQDGLVLAIAMESLVKLGAFLAVGIWASLILFSPGELWRAAVADARIASAFSTGVSGNFLAATLLSGCAILLLPRQFHMTVVENRTMGELRRARWLFPLYLVAINVFVIPIAAAGSLRLGGSADADLYVLALPLAEGADLLSLLAFIGGLSAATAMVIVESVALSIMISNDLVLPFLLKRMGPQRTVTGDRSRLILNIRRTAIMAIVLLGYAYYRATGTGAGLASIGLLSFAAIAQFVPAVLAGLFWRRANARGARIGLLSGIGLWGYTLLLPALLPESAIIREGLFGLAALRPQALFGLSAEPLLHGVVASLGINALCLVAGSLSRAATPIERIQAALFVQRRPTRRPGIKPPRTGVSIGALKAAIAPYLGAERTERAFANFEESEGRRLDDRSAADGATVRFCEQLLGSAIGSASSRLVLSLLFQRHADASRSALRLLDDASEAVRYNRDLLHVALDQVEQGLAVFDADFRLTFWNRQFRDLLLLPPHGAQIGTSLTSILDELVAAGEISRDDAARSLDSLSRMPSQHQITLEQSERIIEIRGNRMPGGGFVAAVSDMTERVRRAAALRGLNETLEERVRLRTAELTRVNADLAEARQAADDANLGKTRFLAAAGHDILQPLNAAKLYAAALQERRPGGDGGELAGHIGASLEAVEAILGAVLDISRLDTGAMEPQLDDVPLQPLLRQVVAELRPLATAKGVSLRLVPTQAAVRTDRNLLRRLVQNLVSNAVKYTPGGKVVVGVRYRRGGQIELQVLDSGIGIPADKLDTIFQEFLRLDEGSRTAPGLGLGLSIVERIARVLSHPVSVQSVHGRGTSFRLTIPQVKRRPAEPASAPASFTPHGADALRGTRVLCIDNEAAIRAGMATLLGGWGCSVTVSGGTEAALEACRDAGGTPDIVLADYHLDGETGLDAIRRLRAALGPELPAILITADRSPAVAAEAAALGVDVLTKPLKPASLRASMARRRISRDAAE
ncbi:PAS domain-containing hybrid sensor histidine kinase/response regulator [Mangrovicella endophytica]|uniref:hybrid sensor histidine kinase/response regulator n=1 Tax=Mangrovicella endophytica TaxID=2066697 RepID=UPI000C9EC69A|nr:PAS domain-containing hybrid sensor histidine kinase/response regulator [Mangrovicella endophytica]